jgi:hypothetical protein
MLVLMVIILINMMPKTSASFSSRADYKCEFDDAVTDNATITTNGFTHSYIKGWDGTYCTYLNESGNSTDEARILVKNQYGDNANDTYGVYFEYRMLYNDSNLNSYLWYIAFYNSILNYGYKPGESGQYILNGTTSESWSAGVDTNNFNASMHRAFVYFDYNNGTIYTAFDDKITVFRNKGCVWNPTAIRIYIMNDCHPGMMVDNIKVFNDSNDSSIIQDYLDEYYPTLKCAYPPNNYDFGLSLMVHADSVTYNYTKNIFSLMDEYKISVGQNYFFSNAGGSAIDTLSNSTVLSLALANKDKHGIYTHSLENIDLNTSTMASTLESWKTLVGWYPLIWTDHGSISQTLRYWGTVSNSSYYMQSLRNSTSLKYCWINYGGMFPLPDSYNCTDIRNGFDAWFNYTRGAVYSAPNMTGTNIDNLFHSASRSLYPSSTTPWYDYMLGAVNHRGILLDHTYSTYYSYVDLDTGKYTKCTPLPNSGVYKTMPSSWSNFFGDNNGTEWKIIPEYRTRLNELTENASIYSELSDKMLDRSVITNSTIVSTLVNTVYVNSSSILENVTIYTRANYSGKALYQMADNYYPFTKGYYSWGAVIPSNLGNNSYNIVPWTYTIDENQNIGRLWFRGDGDIDIHAKSDGTIRFQTINTSSPTSVKNVTNGNTTMSFTFSGGNLSFDAGNGYHYYVDYTTTSAPITPTFTTTTDYLTEMVIPIMIAVALLIVIVAMFFTGTVTIESLITWLIMFIIAIVVITTII